MNTTLDKDLLTRSGIPSRFWREYDDSFIPKLAKKQVESFVRGRGEYGIGLYIYGGQDSGKSYLLSFALMQAMTSFPNSVKRYTVEEITDFNYGDNRRYFEETFKNLVMLGIDNMDGLDRPHQGKVDSLERALRVCKDWGVTFVIASNLSHEDVEKHYGHHSAELIHNYTNPLEIKTNPMKQRDYFDNIKEPC